MAGSDRAWRTSSFPSGSDIVMVGVTVAFFEFMVVMLRTMWRKMLVVMVFIYLFIYFELVV